jgi:hypothetical protein
MPYGGVIPLTKSLFDVSMQPNESADRFEIRQWPKWGLDPARVSRD